MKVRTRFAPSPTGRMHVGNLRTALYAYLIAKHEDGDYILRIEDTDQQREMEGAVDIIYNTLKKTGLIWDEGPDKDKGVGPYVQSERQAAGIYLEYAKKLIEKERLITASATRRDLLLLRQRSQARKLHVMTSIVLISARKRSRRILQPESLTLSDRTILQQVRQPSTMSFTEISQFQMKSSTTWYSSSLTDSLHIILQMLLTITSWASHT